MIFNGSEFMTDWNAELKIEITEKIWSKIINLTSKLNFKKETALIYSVLYLKQVAENRTLYRKAPCRLLENSALQSVETSLQFTSSASYLTSRSM